MTSCPLCPGGIGWPPVHRVQEGLGGLLFTVSRRDCVTSCPLCLGGLGGGPLVQKVLLSLVQCKGVSPLVRELLSGPQARLVAPGLGRVGGPCMVQEGWVAPGLTK